MTELVANGIKKVEILEVKEVVETQIMSGKEDFAYYLEKIPSRMFYVGAKPADSPVYIHIIILNLSSMRVA